MSINHEEKELIKKIEALSIEQQKSISDAKVAQAELARSLSTFSLDKQTILVELDRYKWALRFVTVLIVGSELQVVALLIDGVHFGEHVVLAAVGVDAHGDKHVLGLREGATENAAAVRALLADLAERGLATDRSLLIVIDGPKRCTRPWWRWSARTP